MVSHIHVQLSVSSYSVRRLRRISRMLSVVDHRVGSAEHLVSSASVLEIIPSTSMQIELTSPMWMLVQSLFTFGLLARSVSSEIPAALAMSMQSSPACTTWTSVQSWSTMPRHRTCQPICQCSSRASVALTTNLADEEVGARFVDVRVDELQLEAGIVHRGEHLAPGLVTPGLLTSVYRSWHKSRRRYHPRRPCSHEHTRPEIQALVDALRLAMLARGIRGQMMHTAAGDNSCNSGEEESKLGEHVERWFKVRSLLDSQRDECSGVALPPERRRSYRCEGHC